MHFAGDQLPGPRATSSRTFAGDMPVMTHSNMFSPRSAHRMSKQVTIARPDAPRTTARAIQQYNRRTGAIARSGPFFFFERRIRGMDSEATGHERIRPVARHVHSLFPGARSPCPVVYRFPWSTVLRTRPIRLSSGLCAEVVKVLEGKIAPVELAP